MFAAANYAFANRQLLAHFVRVSFEQVLAGKVADWQLRQVYDVAHNIAKVETHTVEGRAVKLVVHRKGATRAFPPGHPDLAARFRQTGQPVLVPGSMGTASFVLVGTPEAMTETFGSTCHGAGRMMSRKAATRSVRGEQVQAELKRQGILVQTGSLRGLAEEAPHAYKDVSVVVESVVGAGLARKVARVPPLAFTNGCAFSPKARRAAQTSGPAVVLGEKLHQAVDVGRFQAAVAAGHCKLHLVALVQGLEAAGLDVGVVDENVLTAICGGDEAVTFFLVEPLDGAGPNGILTAFHILHLR